MSSLSRQEQLLQLIHEQEERLRQTFPAQMSNAIIALTQARDWRYLNSQEILADAAQAASPQNLLYASGWQKALQLCFGDVPESPYVSHDVPDSTLDAWADRVLRECDRLTAGEQVLAYCESE